MATLTYHYQSRTVWLDPADAGVDAGWGLCANHAENLKVPVGWALEDRRPVEVPPLRPPVAIPGTRPDAGPDGSDQAPPIAV